MFAKLTKEELAENLDFGTDPKTGALLINGRPVKGSACSTCPQKVFVEIKDTVFELTFELAANKDWTPKSPERAQHLDKTNRNFADRMAI